MFTRIVGQGYQCCGRMGLGRTIGDKAMKKSIVIITAVAVLAFAGLIQAAIPPWFEYVIAYDGYVERHSPGGVPLFSADTLFVINNTDPTDMMDVWVEVFNKHGDLIWEDYVWNGGQQVKQINPDGFGWFTLGMMLNLAGVDTVDPWGNPAAEKFFVRISAAHQASSLNIIPTVEVKQVLYLTEIDLPEFAIWQPMVIKSWSEAALGGNRRTTGVIWPQ